MHSKTKNSEKMPGILQKVANIQNVGYPKRHVSCQPTLLMYYSMYMYIFFITSVLYLLYLPFLGVMYESVVVKSLVTTSTFVVVDAIVKVVDTVDVASEVVDDVVVVVGVVCTWTVDVVTMAGVGFLVSIGRLSGGLPTTENIEKMCGFFKCNFVGVNHIS